MTTSEGRSDDFRYEPWVREILRCPACHHELEDVTDEQGEAALRCTAPHDDSGRRLRFPVVDGIPVLLLDDATEVPAD